MLQCTWVLCCGASLRRPSFCKHLALTVVAAGVGILFGGHMGGVGGLCTLSQDKQADFGSLSVF